MVKGRRDPDRPYAPCASCRETRVLGRYGRWRGKCRRCARVSQRKCPHCGHGVYNSDFVPGGGGSCHYCPDNMAAQALMDMSRSASPPLAATPPPPPLRVHLSPPAGRDEHWRRLSPETYRARIGSGYWGAFATAEEATHWASAMNQFESGDAQAPTTHRPPRVTYDLHVSWDGAIEDEPGAYLSFGPFATRDAASQYALEIGPDHAKVVPVLAVPE